MSSLQSITLSPLLHCAVNHPRKVRYVILGSGSFTAGALIILGLIGAYLSICAVPVGVCCTIAGVGIGLSVITKLIQNKGCFKKTISQYIDLRLRDIKNSFYGTCSRKQKQSFDLFLIRIRSLPESQRQILLHDIVNFQKEEFGLFIRLINIKPKEGKLDDSVDRSQAKEPIRFIEPDHSQRIFKFLTKYSKLPLPFKENFVTWAESKRFALRELAILFSGCDDFFNIIYLNIV
jgi:hypothetical protein